MARQLKCQAQHAPGDGCATCGGYGYIIVERACPNCGHKCWVRPGVFTSYVGKIWISVDGVKITMGENGTSKCQFCPVEK